MQHEIRLRAHIFLAGDCPSLYPGDFPREGELVIAVDGGYAHTQRLGIRPDLLLGDFDSISTTDLQRAEQSGTALQRWPVVKDFTDAELALQEAHARGASWCRLYGTLGGTRVDHMLANIFLLVFWKKRGMHLEFVHDTLWATVLHAEKLCLHGKSGDLVSLLPFSECVEHIRFSGVKYPLRGEQLSVGESRGVSNEMVSELAELEIGSGLLLVMHYRR